MSVISETPDSQADDAAEDTVLGSEPDLFPVDTTDLVEDELDVIVDAHDPISTDIVDATDIVDDEAGTQPFGPARYLEGRVHSPLNAFVVTNLRDIASSAPARDSAVFMKVGDSISIDTNFLTCLASGEVDLTGRTELQDALTHFRSGDADGSTPFDRSSEATLGGRTASWAITGDPESPLEREVAAINPRIAVVMFGTNDMGWYPSDMPRMFRWYGDAYMTLIDDLIEQGIIPVVSSIPPREDSAFLGSWVPTVNQFVRGVAQSRQIPFVDFHMALQPLPDFGLWPDGVHPDVAPSGGCNFNESGLEHGQNMRNLITLEVLDRLYETVIQESGALDTDVWELAGSGTVSEPLVIDALPFSDWRNTTTGPSDIFDTYSDCSDGQDESGREVVYLLELDRTVRLRALVLDQGSVDIDIHLLDDNARADACLTRNDTMIQGTVGPGTYYIVADTFVSSTGTVRDGEYLLVVTTCEDGDSACDQVY